MPNWKKIALSGSNPEFASLNVDNAVSASAFTGSFVGDGSGLSNVSVAEVATVTDTFTSVTSSTVAHTFDTKNVIVQVYDNSDNLVIPQSITTSTTSSVDIVFDSITSGRVIVAKGGHIVTGSIQIASSSTVSDTFTAQTSYTASHTFGTSDVFVQVYDNTDSLILPQKVKILTTGSVGLDFDTTTTGKVIIGKSGHIVSGSAEVSTVAYSNVTSKPALISSSAQIASDISGSFTSVSASIATDIIAAHTGSFTGSFVGNGASLTGLVSASFASTGPFLSNTGGTVDGDLTLTGTLTAQTYIVSSSVTYMTQSFSSGSTIFGDSLDDTHLFTGSLNVTGSANLVASQSVNNNTSSGSLSFWQGSESEYNAISNSADNNTIYFVV